MNRLIAVLAVTGLTMAATASAIPTDITYQGSLKQQGLPATGIKNMIFRITNVDGTQVYWSSPSTAVNVNNGLFSTHISPVGVDWQSVTPYVEVSVEGQLLLPREPVNSTVYAAISNSVTDAAITPAKVSAGFGLVPAGSLLAFAGGTPPAGWLVCDGSAVSRSAYAALFAAIGTTWGAGDGSSTFNVPDLRGRATIGSGQGAGLTNRALGQILGEENHQLTIAEMPSHNHGVNDPGHSHGLYFGTPGGSDNNFGESFVPGRTNTQTVTALTGVTIKNTGGDGAHNVMQPSAVVTYLIRT